MAVLPKLMLLFAQKRLKEIDYFRYNPFDVQTVTFNKLIKSAKNTFWGQKYDYASIKNINRYQERVPVSTYEALSPYIERVRKGESNVLWQGKMKWFAMSSGTTNDKSKYIPISAESLQTCHYQGGRDVVYTYLQNNPQAKLFKDFGKALVIGGSRQLTADADQSIYYGDLSAVLLQNLPFWYQKIRTPDISIALMPEWEEKIYKMAIQTMKVNVTSISGVPSWTLVLIKKILDLAKTNNILNVWKNLELFIHGGVSFAPYQLQYKQLIQSDRMNYLETYNASEGFFALQDDPNETDMLLMMDLGVFYEFIPMENIGQENPKAIQLVDVELDKNYAMLISTNTGLWRYQIGDTVKFTSILPYKIKITGRVKHFINAFGEELIIENAQIAIQKACEATQATIKEFTAAPIYMEITGKGSHEWFIEFDKHPTDLSLFTQMLDKTLKSVNSDYEAKRYKNLSLEMPKVVVAKEGVFYQWLKERYKLGGQNKIPRLANHRDYIDALLKLNV
jgi:hypothetical protein